MTPDRDSLDRSLLQGLSWTASVKWGAQILRWAVTLIVARILDPTDYGLVGMASVYLGLVMLVSDFGLSRAIIQERELSTDQLARLGGFSLVLGVLLAGASVALSGLIAAFFREPAVSLVVAAMSVNFALRGAQVLPKGLLSRELRFRRLAGLEGLEALVLSASTLVLAVLGFRYWSLVLGIIIATTISTVAALLSRPHRIAWPSRISTISSPLLLGWRMVVSTISWYLYSNADFALVGRVLGSQALGYYTIGWNIGSQPVKQVSTTVLRVAPGVFSAVQESTQDLRRYMLALTEGISVLAFPASIGLALVAPELVVVVLGEKWEPAALPLRLLAAYAGYRSTVPVLNSLLVAAGRARMEMRFNLLLALVLPIAFYIGCNWGLGGVAFAWAVAYPLITLPTVTRLALSVTKTSWRSYFQSMWPAISATLTMTGAVIALKLVLAGEARPAVSLVGSVVLGAATYCAALLLAHGPRLRRLSARLGRMRNG